MTTIRKPAATGDDRDREGDLRRLESTLVRYDGGPDRRTVYPPGSSGVSRMSTWLTADDDAFVDLADAR